MVPITPEAAIQIALAHQQAGRLTQAEALYRQVLTHQPNNAYVWHRLGLLQLAAGRHGEAVGSIRQAISHSPNDASYYSDLGVAHWQLGHGAEAVASFQRALSLRPDFAHTHRNLGDSLTGMGKLDEAIASYQRALALTPNDAGAHNNIGNALMKMRRLAEAAQSYQRAAQLDPGLLQAHSNLGDVLMKLGRPDDAIECCHRVLALNPKFPGGHLNMGTASWQKGDFGKAEECFQRALACQSDFADAHLSLGVLLLLLGRFEEGWHEYEWRWRSPAHTSRLRNFSAPAWEGAPAPGKTILVHADQGFGDTLQFLRYLPLVRERSGAARVILECQPELISLVKQVEDSSLRVVGRDSSGEGLPPFDLHISLLSLPLALKQYEPAPMTAPYLRPDPGLRQAWRARLGSDPAFRVGLAWAGSPLHEDDRRRSLRPEQLLPILRVPGVSFVSLQIEPRAPLPQILATAGLRDFAADIRDFADTAALMAELDLIISVDTATIHLAGALGRPVWTLLPFVPDWRWRTERKETPWYPTMRLVRQPSAGDWDSVIANVVDALAVAAQGPSRS